MSYSVSGTRKASVRAVLEALEGAQRIVLTTHLNADGDGTGSEVALAAYLEARGKDVWIINPTPFPAAYRFLLPDESWVVAASDPRAAQLCSDAELAVILDTGEKSRIGRVKPMLNGLPKVIVDHHPPGDDAIEGVSFRVPEACATGELVYDLLFEAGGPWTMAAVNGLYVAILTDTGSFRHSNTSSRCHQVTAQLVDAGADPEVLHRAVYGAFPIRRLQLLKATLETLATTDDGTVAWMTVPDESYRRLGATPDDLEGLVDHPREIAGVEVAALFRTIKGGGVKVSLRSNGPVDVNQVARTFGGGGHVRAAGAMLKEPLEAATTRVIQAIHDEVCRLGCGPEEVVSQEPPPPDAVV